MVSLYDLLLETADSGCNLQDSKSGRMPSGHNGPWKNIDTSVRNTGHWAILFLAAYEHSDDDKYYLHARNCINFLQSDIVRPEEYTFYHRKDGPDHCNGLIGQSWTIEALSYAADYFDDDILSIAEEVFLLHPFDSELGLWHSVDIDGSIHSVHSTFNQQLWFAAIGAQLANENKEIKTQVSRFLDRLQTNIRLTDNGLIVHNNYPHEGYRRLRYNVKNALFSGLREWRKELAVGYHSFNLYGMALLYREFPSHPFWETTTFESILRYAASDQYLSEAKENQYCFGYNPTGLELAFASETFDRADLTIREWVERQLSLTFNPLERLMNRGSDPTTLAARFYEAVRLSDLELDHAPLFVEG